MAMGFNFPSSGISPGTMPAAVPGNSRTDFLGAIRPASPGQGPVPGLIPTGASLPRYESVTQADGSVLLHILNADGSLGPAVKIVSGVSPKSQPPM